MPFLLKSLNDLNCTRSMLYTDSMVKVKGMIEGMIELMNTFDLNFKAG